MSVAEVTNKGKEPDLMDAVVTPGLERTGPAQAKPLWSEAAPGPESDRPRSRPPDPWTKK